MDVEDEDLRFLRRELLFRMTVQNGVLILNAIAFLIVSIVQHGGDRSPAGLALAFVLFSAILAATWCHHGARQAQIKRYVMLVHARHSADEGWEGWLPRHGFADLLGSRWFVSTKASFIGTGFAACIQGAALDGAPGAVVWTGLALATAAGSTLLLLTNPREGLGDDPR